MAIIITILTRLGPLKWFYLSITEVSINIGQTLTSFGDNFPVEASVHHVGVVSVVEISLK